MISTAWHSGSFSGPWMLIWFGFVMYSINDKNRFEWGPLLNTHGLLIQEELVPDRPETSLRDHSLIEEAFLRNQHAEVGTGWTLLLFSNLKANHLIKLCLYSSLDSTIKGLYFHTFQTTFNISSCFVLPTFIVLWGFGKVKLLSFHSKRYVESIYFLFA